MILLHNLTNIVTFVLHNFGCEWVMQAATESRTNTV